MGRMGHSRDDNKAKTPNREPRGTGGARAAGAERQATRILRATRSMRTWVEQRAGPARRRLLFEQDAAGRTLLFCAAEQGLEELVQQMIYSLRGTGMSPPRLALIATVDHAGLTAADVAEQNGYDEIARVLRAEQGRMEFFE